LASAESRPVALTAETTGAVATWPVKVADAGDRVPAEAALAYAQQANQPPRVPVTRGLTAPNAVPRNAAALQPTRGADGASRPARIRTASAGAAVPSLKAGTLTDDLWLRALVLAPNLRNYLTATVLGQSDMRELLPLMEKPDAVVTTGF